MLAKEYDVLIIGSGASGGMAAHTLTKQGVNCLMLDAGPLVDFNRVRGTKQASELPYRGFGQPGRLPRLNLVRHIRRLQQLPAQKAQQHFLA